MVRLTNPKTTTFQSFLGHLIPYNPDWYMPEIYDFFGLEWTCEPSSESVWPPIASSYTSSGFANLRWLAWVALWWPKNVIFQLTPSIGWPGTRPSRLARFSKWRSSLKVSVHTDLHWITTARLIHRPNVFQMYRMSVKIARSACLVWLSWQSHLFAVVSASHEHKSVYRWGTRDLTKVIYSWCSLTFELKDVHH